MRTFKEVKEIAKCVSKIGTLVKMLEGSIDTEGINWYTATLVPLKKEDIEHFEKSNGETVPLAFTVGYKFRFDGDWYGGFIEFDGEEPKLEAIEEAANLVFEQALESYKMLCSGVRDVPATQFDDAHPPELIKVIETGKDG